MAKTFVLVMFEEGKSKGLINGMKKVISREDFGVLMQEDNASVHAMKGSLPVQYQITSKSIFEFQFGENVVMFCVADVSRKK